jgi:hypothetical protein
MAAAGQLDLEGSSPVAEMARSGYGVAARVRRGPNDMRARINSP